MLLQKPSGEVLKIGRLSQNGTYILRRTAFSVSYLLCRMGRPEAASLALA